MMRRPFRFALAALAATLLFASACSDDIPDEQSATTEPAEQQTAEQPATTGQPAATDGAVESSPAKIISLSPSLTETLFAIGAGEQVIAVDALSNFPEDAPVTDLSGFEPNVEAIAQYEPDLVVVSDDINNVVSGLQALDVPVLQLPAAVTLDDTFAQIEQLGAATGHVADAAGVVAEMQSRIGEILATTSTQPLTYYHELDSTLFSVTSKTFIGEVYASFGLVNIADAADTDGTGYPQLSAEYLLEQDPALIFLADTKCCAESAATAADRPGWSELTAVKNGTVIELDDDIASRWGPRVVDFYQAIADAIATVPVA
ncbi:MAG: ABC transporter substrate-binding protein [Acidimicrobiia bacterium]